MLCLAALAAQADNSDSLGISNDQFESLETHVRSTLMYGGSSPVSFAGEARLKIQEHFIYSAPDYMLKDRTYTNANFEGNESLLRLGMVVRPNRNSVLWAKIGFQHTLPGNFSNQFAESPNIDTDYPQAQGYERQQTRHDKMEETANIHEDMSAGMAIRTNTASAWLRMGNVLWTEASPLTVWKAQPRNFAWDYLPFEVEQPIGRYYEYNIAKGEKSGRAAWNKKALNGIQLESIQLPYDLYLNLMYAAYERYDNFEREYVDFSGDIGYTGETNEAKGRGIGDSYRHLYHMRLAKEKIGPGLTLGFNLNWFHTSSDFLQNITLRSAFPFSSPQSIIDPLTGQRVTILNGRDFYKEPRIASLDLKGDINENWALHVDVGASVMDTTWGVFFRQIDTTHKDSLGATLNRFLPGFKDSLARGAFSPAAFVSVKHQGAVPFRVDAAYISKDFYSPLSFVAPMDAFYPFGSNLVGAGKFIARGEGSPYARNMAGLNLSWTPNPGYGHFRVTYGQHFQLSSARDLIYFPHRLNGQDEFSFFQSSYNRWGNDLVDNSINSGKYKRRLGDESFKYKAGAQALGPEAGGLRSDYLSVFEGFIPYVDTVAADSNLAQGSTALTRTTVLTQSKWVPAHQKWTYNLEVDGGYDIGPFLGYKRDFLVNAYVSFNGIATSPKAIAIDEKGMMLWGLYARLEPAISLFSPRFYLLGLLGYENWKAENAYATPVSTQPLKSVKAPIDYVDWAAGLGCDWDFAERVGLHLRAKWQSHEDKHLSANNYHGRLLSAEIKMWF